MTAARKRSNFVQISLIATKNDEHPGLPFVGNPPHGNMNVINRNEPSNQLPR